LDLDKLHPARLKRELRTGWAGGIIFLLESAGSTNTVCLAMGEGGVPEGTVVIALNQFEGKGRAGREWFSTPEGSLVFSILLRPEGRLEGLTILAAYSIRTALKEICPRTAVKWPNDIYISGKKAGGILARGTKESAVIGAGINVNQKVGDLPEKLRGEATSLRMETGAEFDRGRVLTGILEGFERNYSLWRRDGLAPFMKGITQSLIYLGEDVVLSGGGREMIGKFKGITERGYLILEAPGGVKVCYSGDLSLRRRSR